MWEDRILPALDRWLVDLLALDRIDALAAEIVAADGGEVSDPRVPPAGRQAVEAALKGVDFVCVGGGTGARPPRPIMVPGDWLELRRAG